jgi:hypothetical protein
MPTNVGRLLGWEKVDMTEAEATARLAVLEIVSMTALGYVMASANNGRNESSAEALLGWLREAVAQETRTLPQDGRDEADRYVDRILTALEKTLAQRGGSIGTTH